jgi:hypothetical protein
MTETAPERVQVIAYGYELVAGDLVYWDGKWREVTTADRKPDALEADLGFADGSTGTGGQKILDVKRLREELGPVVGPEPDDAEPVQ